MASSIKIKNHTKSELDKLQAEILVKYGKKLTQQDLIELLLQIGKENIHNHFTQVPMEEKKKGLKKMLNKSSSWGIETNEDMIDEILYGVKKP